MTYDIQVKSADVSYSPFYSKDGESSYEWMGNKIARNKINTLPIQSVNDFKNDACIDVTLHVSWPRVFKIERSISLMSKIFVVPRMSDETEEQWVHACRIMVDSLAESNTYSAFTYVIGDTVGKELFYTVAENKIVSDGIEYTARELPKMERRIDLQSDIYKGCVNPPVTEEAKISKALKSDCCYAKINPGQTSVKILVRDAYDQFALVGFMQETITGKLCTAPGNLSFVSYGPDIFVPSLKEINDRTVYLRGVNQDDNSILRVDHRKGFWQHLFYTRGTAFDWLLSILLLLVSVGSIALVIWLVISRKSVKN